VPGIDLALLASLATEVDQHAALKGYYRDRLRAR
jgi:hypothetical protein